MSLTRPEKILVSVVLIILFIVSNIAAFLIIQKVLNVSMFDSDYDITQEQYIKRLSGKRVHPFYGLSDGIVPGFESIVSSENNFRSVSPLKSANPINVLVLGGSVAMHLSEAREDIVNDYLFAHELNKRFDTDQFVVYNAAFGGGKQPQQYFKMLYLDLLGFNPDLIINYDGFNEVALSIGQNLENNLNAIYPRNFYESLGASVYDGSCFSLNNKLLSFNSYMPIIELVKWIYIRGCHNEAVWSGVSKKMSNQELIKIEQKDFISRTFLIWEESSNKIYEYAKLKGVPYIHVLQPNRHQVGSKPLSTEELYGNNANKKPLARPLSVSIERHYDSLDMSNLIAEYKIDQRSLFITEERTVYSDQCCHFNKLGMETIIDDIIIKAEPVFRKLTVDK